MNVSQNLLRETCIIPSTATINSIGQSIPVPTSKTAATVCKSPTLLNIRSFGDINASDHKGIKVTLDI